MLRFFILFYTMAAVVAANAPTELFGIVEGIKDCGSAGQLGTVTVPDCDIVPCTFVPGSTYNIEIRFTASLTSSALALQVYKLEGAIPLLEVPIPGEIQAGIEYELKFSLTVGSELSGEQFDMGIYILDLSTLSNEICAEAPIIVA